MDERYYITKIIKSNDPEKLVVFRAASLKNQIRFYLNETQYLTAIENDKGCIVKLENLEKGKKVKISKISIIKQNLTEFIKLFSIVTGISLLGSIVVWYLAKVLNNILVFLLTMNFIYFFIQILITIIIESIETAPSLKSKHSAEHMMVNFLETNKRLPKNIEEVKKCSRFSPNCGSRKLIESVSEYFVQGIIATIFSVIVSGIVFYFFNNSIIYAIVLLESYYLIKFIVAKPIIKHGKLNFIIIPMRKVLTNVAQLANTTNKVKDNDIILAYLVAKQWMKIVYPEFYDENESIFWKKIIES